MDYKPYMQRIGNVIGKNADRIDEDSWKSDVMGELNVVSKDCAKEMQKETGASYEKRYTDGTLAYTLQYYEAPPMRLYAMELALASWLGWIMHEKGGRTASDDCMKSLQDAYNFGVNMSLKKENP